MKTKCPKCREWRCHESAGPCFNPAGPPLLKPFEKLQVERKPIVNGWHLCVLPSARQAVLSLLKEALQDA